MICDIYMDTDRLVCGFNIVYLNNIFQATGLSEEEFDSL